MSTDSPADDRLLALYRRFVGEPEGEIEVYLGFALFFGGIALGALGFVLFLWSSALGTGAGIYWQLRELAIVLAVLGLPAFVLSLVVLLPVDRRARYAAGVGGLVCVLAAAVFVATYPENWNVARGPDYSAQGIAVYAGGLAVLAASSGAGLVGHRLQRARGVPGTAGSPGEASGSGASAGGTTTDTGETVTEEQVQRDIEEAMESTELTWGGVERDDTKRITIDTDDADIDTSGFDADKANTTTSSDSSVDEAVDGLRKLQGRDRQGGTSDAVDDQAQALAELRERQAREEDEKDSTIDRLRDRLGI